MEFSAKLNKALETNELPEKVYIICRQLYESYAASMLDSGFQRKEFDPVFEDLLSLVIEQVKNPFPFTPHHHKIEQPYNYFQFGLDFVRPLVDTTRTHIHGMENLKRISEQIEKGESVVLFANHQTEVDPQLMTIILEKDYRHLGDEVIFVAGDRVLSDPLAAPFSMGRNLLCIYSKRHIDNPPEKKEEKQLHNQRTMNRMKELLSEGAKFIYVAPSGGRDRPNAKGEVEVAHFDPQSIEMFRLMAKHATKPVHFYPLSLVTYDILPPPPSIESELGEIRRAKREGALFDFGSELDMDTFPGSDISDRHEKRSARAQYIWDIVNKNYQSLKSRFNP